MCDRRWCGALLCAVWIGMMGIAHPALALTREEARLEAAYEADELIRLHIVADSDTPEMQALKLCVRDAVIAAFREQMAGADADAVYRHLERNAERMRQVAEDVARSLGFEGEITAEVGRLTLPEKRYGAVMLPAGEYRGLRIVLGRGEGRNWWCVLFPALCLSVASEEPWQEGKGFDGVELLSDAARVLRIWVSPPLWE